MRLQWHGEEIGCSSSSWQVNGEAAAWKRRIVNKSQSVLHINCDFTHCKNSHCVINSKCLLWRWLEGLERFVLFWECHCVCLEVQSSLLFLIWQLFFSLSEAIFTGGRYISAAHRRLVLRDAAALPEITTKSLSRPNQTINIRDCCWNRVSFPVSCLSLCYYSSSPSHFYLLIYSAFFKIHNKPFLLSSCQIIKLYSSHNHAYSFCLLFKV